MADNREIIVFECKDCKRRNYASTKNKKNTKDVKDKNTSRTKGKRTTLAKETVETVETVGTETRYEHSNNHIITENEVEKNSLWDNVLNVNTSILKAILPKLDSNIVNFDNYIKEITPYSGLTQSELFTGSNAGVSLESEIKKEILSADKIYLLVSFIKWSGIRIFEKELKEFTNNGKQLKIITTSYMGATDLKAVEFLASLPNTEIKVSYNIANERLHAKSYLFFRNTGFNTGYIGSSNISKSALTSGLEWNLKVTTAEISHIIKKFEKTFETYWEDKEFELFTGDQKEKLQIALKNDSACEHGLISPSALTAILPRAKGQTFS